MILIASYNTEEADDIASLYALENESEKDEFPCFDSRDARDSVQFYRPWSLSQTPQSTKIDNFDYKSTRSDSITSSKGQGSHRSSNVSNISEYDHYVLPRKRSESRKSIKSNRSTSRKASISNLIYHDPEKRLLETSNLSYSVENSEPTNPHYNSTQYTAIASSNETTNAQCQPMLFSASQKEKGDLQGKEKPPDFDAYLSNEDILKEIVTQKFHQLFRQFKECQSSFKKELL